VSKQLRFAALYPQHLDLNGDHGNLLVLQKRLKWRGVEAQIIPITKPTELESFDFVMLGHGTKDAWAEVLRLEPELIQRVAAFSEAGNTVLAVSSGYKYLIEELDQTRIKHGEHVSEFKNFGETVGYVNSDLVLPLVQTVGQTVMTLMHGPVLAKNPELADRMIQSAGWCDVSITNDKLDSVNQVAAASRKLAFED